jgi:ATP-dependent DNA ligase
MLKLKLKPPIPPTEAVSVDEIPKGTDWQYEPKWDGFRCLAFRDGKNVFLQSKQEKPLARYFPEIVEAVRAVRVNRFVIDGELVVPIDGAFDFDQLLQRIHPAESRIRRLAKETPARFFVFDCIAAADGKSRIDRPLVERRSLLESLAAEAFLPGGDVRLSPATAKLAQARRWFRGAGGDMDGVVAKRLDMPYTPGERSAMVKIKPARSADCVVGGFRYGSKSKLVGSLLLGLYDEEGSLNHVGFTANTPRRRSRGRDEETRTVDKGTRFHRQGAGRPQSVEHGALDQVGTPGAKTRR